MQDVIHDMQIVNVELNNNLEQMSTTQRRLWERFDDVRTMGPRECQKENGTNSLGCWFETMKGPQNYARASIRALAV